MQRVLPDALKTFLAARPGAALLASNAGWLLLDRGMRMVLALSVGAWVARYLGPSQFGELSYALTLIALFQGLANLGADGIIVRDISRDPQNAATVLGTALRLRLMVGLLCWALATGLVFLLRPNDPNAVLLTAIVGASLVFQAAETVDLWFQSQSRNVWTVKAKLLAYISGNAIRIVLLLNHAPLWTFALAALIDVTLLAVALFKVYGRLPVAQTWRYSMAMAKRLVHESAPFMVGGLAVLLYQRVDQIMIREMLGDRALGYYSAAVPLSQVWAVIPVTLATALAPYMARKKVEGQAVYMSALFRIFRAFAGISVLVTVGTAVFAEDIVYLLYGTAFEASGQILSIHVFSNIFLFLGVAQGLWLINEGLGKITLYRTALGVVTCVVGNWLLIPLYGLVGCAVVTVLAQFVAAVASNALFAPHILRMQLRAFLPPFAWRRHDPS